MKFAQGFLLGLALTALFSWHTKSFEGSIALSSSSDTEISSIEDALPCATEAEYKEIQKELNLTTKLDGGLCDGSYLDKFAKTILYMKKLDLQVPPTWPLAGKTSIRHPYEVLRRRIRDIVFEPEQSSLAYQSRGLIHLGAYFFEEPLLKRVETLYHETQHANPMSPTHINCVFGDRMQELGACDYELSSVEDAGAYSYSVAMDYALVKYAPGLTEDDKDNLYSNLLFLLSNRFSNIPSQLANPMEQILVLDAEKKLGRLHPFLSEIEPFDLNNGEVWESLHPNNGNQGLWLQSTTNHIWSWNPSSTEYFQLLPSSTEKKLQVINIEYMNTTNSDFAYPHIIDTKKQIYILTEDEMKPLNYNLNPTRPVQLAQGPRHSFYVLGEEGDVSIYKNTKLETIASAQSFQFLQAGITLSEIYGIDREGKLQSYTGDHWQDSDFQIASLATKYQESTSFRVLLDAEGALHLKYYNADVPEASILKNIKDFSVVRKYALSPAVSRKKENPILPCPARVTYQEPWLGSALGINDKDQLVFVNREGTCSVFLEQVSAVSFETESDKNHIYGFGIPYMKVIFLNGPAKAFYPYTGVSQVIPYSKDL